MISYPQAPNESAEAAFRKWLGEILADDVPVNSIASPLLWAQDWFASLVVEVPGDKTASGNPETYSFRVIDLLSDEDWTAFVECAAA